MVPMSNVGVEAMSAREAEVLEALRVHLTNAEIGQRLHISVRTVESHVSSLLRKLGAADRRDLAARAAELAEVAATAPAVARGVTGLPSTWTSFIGRAAELDEITEAIATNRLVTLLGPGGIGKTRLATVAAEAVAPTFPGGGAFVDLVPVSAEFVVQAVAAALNVIERPQETLENLVHERLRHGRALVVLDNCEHLLEAASTFVHGVLAACPHAVVLATSRERLGVSGERVLPIPPLALTSATDGSTESDAELLFVDRAAVSAAGLDADPTLVAEICRRLDGMPLAIELAAARSGSLGVDGLLAGLDDHLRLLSSASGPASRHRSLRAVIDWSHDLLDDDERMLFRRLGVFAGAFDLTSVVAVAASGDTATASDVVGRLADKSLLVHGRDALGSRWRMLETVHAYAREQLEGSGEREDIERRHLQWAAATAREIERTLDDDGSPWQAWFDAIADDLRAALSAASRRLEVDASEFALAIALGHLTYARRFLVEARYHFDTAVERATDEAAAVLALRLSAGAAFAETRGDIAYEHLLSASVRAAAAGDAATAALTMADAASIGGRAPTTFNDPPAHEHLVALVEQAKAQSPADDLEVSVHVAIAAAWNGRPVPTEPDPALADEALALARRLGDPVCISDALDAVGAAASFAGRFKETSRLTAERIGLLDRLPRHDPRVGGEIADIFHMATEAALAAGELETALASAQLAHDDDMGLAHFAATHLVVPLALRGAFDDALVQTTVMRDGWERTGRPAAGWMAPSFLATALIYGLRGDDVARAHWWELGQSICHQSRPNCFALFVAPRVALHLGQLDRALEAAATPEQAKDGQYGAYAHAVSVEVAVVTGAPDAAQRLAAVSGLANENDFIAACLARAAGRLHSDEAQLEDAVLRWEAIGARFERACTLLLLPSRAAEGQQELAALRCPLPQA
jgi:predicted ATPase/DNA-binding CsgD family transcriptional regulator